MLVALAVLLALINIAALATGAVIARRALDYLERRDALDVRERHLLTTRIQTPELAPAVALAQATDPEPINPNLNLAVKFDDDLDFHEKTQGT